MDFFQHQDVARRKTKVLVVYFVLAVLGMVASLYLVVVLAFGLATDQRNGDADVSQVTIWQPDVLGIVTGATLLIVFGGSLYKIMELSRGGESVATMLGGKRINPNTSDPAERRLVNVVEEMALASGIAVPAVYVLEGEGSINAFAAGFTPNDAVIGVNRGTLSYLTRDELQGVIAHEFSHILNGDMRLNVRLIGLLNGILVLAIIGYYCLRFGGLSGGGGSRNKNGGVVVVIGLAAMLIGYIGLFFGRLIKAAVSRQREFLADASAVQFTRNPDGIAGALKKIGGLQAGSSMRSPEAETASHMFFGSAFKSWMFAPLATHPSLTDRIKRIEPAWSGQFPQTMPLETPDSRQKRKQKPARAKRADFGFGKSLKIPGLDRTIPLDPVLVMASIGSPDSQAMEYSRNLLSTLPAPLEEAIHDVFGARTVTFAMLLDDDDEIRAEQLKLIEQEGEETLKSTENLAPMISQLGPEARLPIIEVVQNTLLGLSDRQYDRFKELVNQLIEADGKITLFEFVVQRGVLQHLDRHFLNVRPPRIDYYSVKAVVGHVVPVLSVLAHAGHRTDEAAGQAFALAMQNLQLDDVEADLLDMAICTPKRLDQSLNHLARCSPQVKQRILRAAIVCVAADQHVTVYEAELLRAIAVSLDCPIPPIFAGAPIPQQADVNAQAELPAES